MRAPVASVLPYPGLRPFQRDEADIFFGREEQTDQLLKRFSTSRFLAVVGPSGCGKSSLVQAGMINALQTGFMARAGARWRIAVMRPGSHPMAHLAAAVLEDSALGQERAGEPHAKEFLLATLERGPLGLIQALQETPMPTGTNLLLLVDQFEEIFRFGGEGDTAEADAFVALLLETAGQREVPVYVVITMRSDYLGDCALFTGLPEALNDNQYLTPRLTRDERRAAIVGPAHVFGGEVDADLVNRLLNELGPDPAQLPALQHVLMRMWRTAPPAKSSGTRPETQGITLSGDVPAQAVGRRLTIADYERVGGLERALSNHADEAFASLDNKQKSIAEIVFRSLCERRADKGDIRRPTSVADIAERARVTPEDILAVVEVFRGPQYGFLVPAVPEPLDATDVLDISHESLIARWTKLSRWADDEARSAETYRFLEQSARMWKAGQAGLWSTPNLESSLAWREREKPTAKWAARYGGNFSLAMEFLDTSAEEHRKQAAKIETERLKKLRRLRFLAAGFGVTALLLMGVIGSAYYLWQRPHVSYFVSFVKVWGQPKGIGELTFDQVRHRPVSFKIITKGKRGHVQRMEVVNSRGDPTSSHQMGTYLEDPDADARGVAWQFAYDASDKVTDETLVDIKGNRVWGFAYTLPNPGRERVRTGSYVGREGYPRYSGNFVEITYTAEGFEEYIRYRNRGGEPVRGRDEAYGQRKRYDAKGRLVASISLDPEGKPMSDEFGNAVMSITQMDPLGIPQEEVAGDASEAVTLTTEGWAIRRTATDENGNVIAETYFDQEGRKIPSIGGYHKITRKLDTSGNIIEEAYWDATGKPTVGKNDCKRLVSKYDERNNPIERTCLGSDGTPTVGNRGFVTWVGKYDSNDNLIEETFLSANSELIASREGYARVVCRHDQSGRARQCEYYGANMAPARTDRGYSRFVVGYDDKGHRSSAAYFGETGHPVSSSEGYARWENDYDAFGNVMRARYFGPDGKRLNGDSGWRAKYDAAGHRLEFVYLDATDKPILGREGYAGWRSDYDSAGNEVLRTYFGLRGEPTFSNDGVAGWTANYNSLGKMTEQRFFGPDGKPATHREGYARISTNYDSRGNVTDEQYFDTDDNPTLHEGYARLTSKFNAQNKITEQAYFDVDNIPIVGPDGWARVVHKYDPRGNRVETAYFGAFGAISLPDKGYHSVRRGYDDHGDVVEITYFAVDGSRAVTQEGYARLVKGYDAFGRLFEQAVFGADDEPVELDGFHRYVRSYDERGNVSGEMFFGSDGRPVLERRGYHAVRYKYDARGAKSEETYYDLADKPVANGETGYATARWLYDERKWADPNKPYRAVEEAFFDGLGKPVSSADGYAETKLKYDERGELIEQSWFDANGRPTLTRDGYAATHINYNVQGQIIYQVFLGTDGNPIELGRSPKEEFGYASYQATYDVHGNNTEIAYYGADGKPVNTGNRYSRIVRKFNSRKQVVEQTTYDNKGHMAVNAWEYARLLQKYDERGKLTEIAAYDAHGRLSEAAYGYARMTKRYDARGNLIEEAYFGADDKPKILNSGCARWGYRYDEQGNQIEATCFGTNDHLVENTDGYARAVSKYDSRRLKIEEAYFGVEGNPVAGISPKGDFCVRWTATYDSAGKVIESTCHR